MKTLANQTRPGVTGKTVNALNKTETYVILNDSPSNQKQS